MIKPYCDFDGGKGMSAIGQLKVCVFRYGTEKRFLSNLNAYILDNSNETVIFTPNS